MKSILIPSFLLLALADKHPLEGRWQSPTSDAGEVATVLFNEDKTFETFMNGNAHIAGSYTVKDSLLTLSDHACSEGGTYKINFFSKGDSVRFQVIDDACTGRAIKVGSVVLGRVKK